MSTTLLSDATGDAATEDTEAGGVDRGFEVLGTSPPWISWSQWKKSFDSGKVERSRRIRVLEWLIFLNEELRIISRYSLSHHVC